MEAEFRRMAQYSTLIRPPAGIQRNVGVPKRGPRSII